MTDVTEQNTMVFDRDDLLDLGDLGALLFHAPQILDYFRKTQAAKLSAIEADLLQLPSGWRGGQVDRDAVLKIVRKHLVNGKATRNQMLQSYFPNGQV